MQLSIVWGPGGAAGAEAGRGGGAHTGKAHSAHRRSALNLGSHRSLWRLQAGWWVVPVLSFSTSVLSGLPPLPLPGQASEWLAGSGRPVSADRNRKAVQPVCLLSPEKGRRADRERAWTAVSLIRAALAM